MSKTKKQMWQMLFAHYPKDLLKQFKKFHNENPHIYKEFARLAHEIRNTGKRKYSSKMLINVIRWNHDISTSKQEPFKINDKYQALYGRLFVYNNPEFLDFFNFRNRDCQAIESDEEVRRTA